MVNERDKPNPRRDIETDERGRQDPNQSDVVGKANEGDDPDPDAVAEEFDDIDEADEDEDLEA